MGLDVTDDDGPVEACPSKSADYRHQCEGVVGHAPYEDQSGRMWQHGAPSQGWYWGNARQKPCMHVHTGDGTETIPCEGLLWHEPFPDEGSPHGVWEHAAPSRGVYWNYDRRTARINEQKVAGETTQITSPPSLPAPRGFLDLAISRQATERSLEEALQVAEGWAEFGYTPESRAYWQGMRDTLRVVLGHTTERPMVTGPGVDIAAYEILRRSPR